MYLLAQYNCCVHCHARIRNQASSETEASITAQVESSDNALISALEARGSNLGRGTQYSESYFRGVTKPLLGNVGIVPILDHESLFPLPFQFY
jgi:hypothetical protein